MDPSHVDDVQELCDYTLKWPTGQAVNDILGLNRGGQWVALEKICGGETGGHREIPFEPRGNWRVEGGKEGR